jgi:5-methylcytosine-specific restriction endonuclease McrA
MSYPDLMNNPEYKYQRYWSARIQDKVEGVKRGPNGFRLCRWCRKEVDSKRRTFCGADECIRNFNLRGGHFRLVHKRDRGICAICKVDTKYDCDVDHIIPVCEGGGCCGLSNLRTLCKPCHKVETKKLVERRAKRRKLGK